MDGPRLSTSGHSHFSSRQTRLLQLGTFVGRCAGAASGNQPRADNQKSRRLTGVTRRNQSDSFAATSWLAPVTPEEEPSQNPEVQASEAVSHPAIRPKKSESSSDRYPGPLHAHRTLGSRERTTDTL